MNKPKATPRSPTSGDKDIGKRIRFYRAAKGISQNELGDHLGVSFQQIQKLEKGQNRCGADRLTRIASFLGVTTNDLLGTKSDGSPTMNGETADLLSFMGKQGNLRLIRACMKLTVDQRYRLTEFVEMM